MCKTNEGPTRGVLLQSPKHFAFTKRDSAAIRQLSVLNKSERFTSVPPKESKIVSPGRKVNDSISSNADAGYVHSSQQSLRNSKSTKRDNATTGKYGALEKSGRLDSTSPKRRKTVYSEGKHDNGAIALIPGLTHITCESNTATVSTHPISQKANVVEKATSEHDNTIKNHLHSQADNGNVQAMHRLGSLYSKGLFGVEKDQAKSFHWFKRAADKNHIPSLAIAGSRLLNGIGAIARIPDALILLSRAAQAGSDLGTFMLGDLYRNGRSGVRRDREQACYWLRKIVDNKCAVKHAHLSIYRIAASWLREMDSSTS